MDTSSRHPGTYPMAASAFITSHPHKGSVTGYQDSNPLICALLIGKQVSADRIKRSLCRFTSGFSVKIIRGVCQPAHILGITIPGESFESARDTLCRGSCLSYPDTRYDLAIRTGNEIPLGGVSFPAILEMGDGIPEIESRVRKLGGRLHQLDVIYLAFSHPLCQWQRSEFLANLIREPGIFFIILEFPEG